MDTVRSAREQDVPLLSAIGFAAWQRAVVGLVDSQQMGRVAELSFLSFLGKNWPIVSVVERDGAMAGWAAREDGDGSISDLWIVPQFQRTGLGSLLLSDLERRIRAEDFEVAAIKTHAQNVQAIAFFKKHDYAIRWLLTTYSPKLDRDVESVGMSKMFESQPVGSSHQEWF